MREFGHKRPLREPGTGEIIAMVDSPVGAITRGALDGRHGCDRDKRLAVTLEAGDLIVIRPLGTRRPMKASAFDVYQWMVRCEASRLVLERAREARSRKAQRLADARQRRAEKRLRRPLK